MNFAKSYLPKSGIDLDLKSSAGRRVWNAQTFCTDTQQLDATFNAIAHTIELLRQPENETLFIRLDHKLYEIQDITGTLYNLQMRQVLGDIELFEVKNFALVAEQIRALTTGLNLTTLPDLNAAIDVLDPAHDRIATFYIYDTYDPELPALRKQMQACDEVPAELFDRISAIEDRVRNRLSQQLEPHVQAMSTTLNAIAALDILIAKAQQAIALKLCRPILATNEHTIYKALFNPPVQAALKANGKTYQPVDIAFENVPTLITGLNMGGKTVLLRTLALAQYMCQFGMFVPAQSATIALVDNIMICIDDEQNPLQGLSSFAMEMQRVNEILLATERPQRLLVLIDELARTTNPTEGRAIVDAMLQMLTERRVRAFITTHYDHISTPCRHLRVRGLLSNASDMNIHNIDRYIDYSLVEETARNVPHEALRIAAILGVNDELIARAEKMLKQQ